MIHWCLICLDFNFVLFSKINKRKKKSCWSLLRNVRRAWLFFLTPGYVFMQALAISTLYYSASFISQISSPQRIQKIAAHLGYNLPKFSHGYPLLRNRGHSTGFLLQHESDSKVILSIHASTLAQVLELQAAGMFFCSCQISLLQTLSRKTT